MIEKLLLSLLVGASKSPEIRDFTSELVREFAETVSDRLLPQLTALFTGNLDEFAASIARKVLDRDPDVPGFSDIIDVSEILRKWLG